MIKPILEQLAEHPGVRLVALVMQDGVPVHVHGRAARTERFMDSADGSDAAKEANALAALSAGWVHEVMGAIAPLSWETPSRMTLSCARGTLVLRRAHTAWLLVLLTGGLRTEDVILAMDGTAARVERLVRGASGSTGSGKASEPPGILPGAPPEHSLLKAEQESPRGK